MKIRKDYPYLLLEFNKKAGSPLVKMISVIEGDDDAYYSPRVSAHLHSDADMVYIKGDGKENVIRLHKFVSSRPDVYSQDQYLFYVDRDYDAFETVENRYVTNTHSVENLYVGEVAFRNIIKAKFHFASAKDEAELEAITKQYRLWSNQLAESMFDFNGWLIWQLSQPRDEAGQFPILNLKNVKLSDLFELTFAAGTLNIRPIFTLEDAAKIFPNSHTAIEEDICAIQASLSGKDVRSYIRGKFAIQFLQSVLNYLKSDASSQSPAVFFERRKASLTWSDAFLTEYSSYAETPRCLVDFLRRNIRD